MSQINYKKTLEFEKDFKKLLKKFRTLEGDISIAKKNAIELFHLQKIDNESVFLIPNFYNEKVKIYKLKKIACRSLKGRGVKSGIRIIYAFYEKDQVVDFIEIYFKGEKEMEDKKRIKEYLANILSN